MSKPNISEGWGEYAHTILSKLEELHQDNKETKKAIEEIRLAIVKLEINKQEVTSLREWRKEVSDVWSPVNMREALKQIYIQKGKWSVVYGVIVALQVIWGIIIAYLKLGK